MVCCVQRCSGYGRCFLNVTLMIVVWAERIEILCILSGVVIYMIKKRRDSRGEEVT